MNHSKQILALLAMSGLFVACVPKFPQDREAILRPAQELNDSINRLMQSGDSAKLADAMFLHDQLLQLDTVRDHQFRYIMQRVTTLYSLGHDADAFTLQEQAMLLLPENNFDRLNYFGVKNDKLGLKDKSDFFFNMALEVCNEAMEHHGSTDALIDMITVLCYKGREADARQLIEATYLKHKDIPELKNLATDPSFWKQIEESVQKMKAIKLELPDSIQ